MKGISGWDLLSQTVKTAGVLQWLDSGMNFQTILLEFLCFSIKYLN